MGRWAAAEERRDGGDVASARSTCNTAENSLINSSRRGAVRTFRKHLTCVPSPDRGAASLAPAPPAAPAFLLPARRAPPP